MQVQHSTSFYQNFGGINFMDAHFRNMKLEASITQHLGTRSMLAEYSYSRVIKSLFYNFSIGGEVLDDLNTLKKQLSDHPYLKICSPDTVEYVSQELKQENTVITTDKGVKHHFNESDSFNQLLPTLCLQGGILNSREAYTLDYDGHIVENEKADNAFTYKGTEGYYPVLASIKKLPVYMQNRNGNTPESFKQLDAIKKALAGCKANGIRVGKFRADACGYEKDTLNYLEAQNIIYHIRAEMNAGLRIALEDEPEWQPAYLGIRKVEVCSIEEKLFGEDKYRRLVAYRVKAAGQLSIDDTNGYRYYAIVTNDENTDIAECIKFYNQRGCEGEHHFKELDYDFGWNKLPFDNMPMNTVYMYATLVSYLFFNIFKKLFSTKISFVNTTMRLKNFTLHFVTLTAKWIKTARQYVLRIFTDKDYAPIYANTV
jgi:hypothetical protein